MPSEPDKPTDKPIEPLLGAYAARRREAAGQPGHMPPQMRQALHAEVRRRWPGSATGQPPNSAAPKTPWWRSLTGFWPRLATAGGIALVLAVTLVWLLPGLQPARFAQAPSSAKEASVDALEERLERESRTTAGRPVQRASETRDLAAAPPAPPDRATAAAPATRAESAPALSPLAAAAPPPRPARAAPTADARVPVGAEGDRPSRLSLVGDRTDVTAASAPRKTEAAAPVGNAGTFRADAAQPSLQRFVTQSSKASPAVLGNFSVEQSGAAVRLIDADGSVYEGRILNNDGTAQATAPALSAESTGMAGMAPADYRARSSAPTFERKLRGVTSRNGQPTPPAGPSTLRNSIAGPPENGTTPSDDTTGLAFEAIGTNATLRQRVQLNGRLYLTAGPLAQGQAQAISTPGTSQSVGLGFQNSQAAPGPISVQTGYQPAAGANVPQRGYLPNLGESSGSQIIRIRGQAQYGRTNSIEIDAVPVNR